jgi:hypothetical protein
MRPVFPDRDPIGQTMRGGLIVVGVVKDSSQANYDQPVLRVETMDDVVADSIWRPRFSAWIFSGLCGLLDLAALNAGSTHADALCRAVDHGPDGLQVHVPTPFAHVVRVADLVSKLRAAPAHITHFCHCPTTLLVLFYFQ